MVAARRDGSWTLTTTLTAPCPASSVASSKGSGGGAPFNLVRGGGDDTTLDTTQQQDAAVGAPVTATDADDQREANMIDTPTAAAALVCATSGSGSGCDASPAGVTSQHDAVPGPPPGALGAADHATSLLSSAHDSLAPEETGTQAVLWLVPLLRLAVATAPYCPAPVALAPWKQ